MTDPITLSPPLRDDPIFVRARREAIIILAMWFCCFVWTTTYCYLNGYLSHEAQPEGNAAGPDIARIAGPLEEFNRDPKSLDIDTYFGIPDWVFWGVVAPWIVCVVFSLGFCVFVFAEDELGNEEEARTEEQV